MSTLAALPGLDTFELPPDLEAGTPPEARGLRRDGVRLLVAHKVTPGLEHRYFTDLPALLDPGDVVVINTSATLPASLPATTVGRPAALQLSGRLPGGLWVVELRHRHLEPADEGYRTRPWLDAETGTVVDLPAGGRAVLRIPVGTGLSAGRLWVASVELPEPVLAYLARHGYPIRYSYVSHAWPLDTYQTVFGQVPGSAEMPSAARPFSTEVTTRLVSRGVVFAPFVLHCGVSSLEAHEPPAPEWYRVPPSSAAVINQARGSGHRVIAVGTTAVRALETVADPTGSVHPGEGWTEVVVDASRPIRAVDGLITGWHEPGASHLALLQAMAGRDLVAASYAAALQYRYLWHEFGDSHLILP
jgi:S-adenosylmethionine:tRNA ribosyltransferase-isomerase